MERYIGLDVHAASCTLAVISQAGRRLKDFPVETNGQALVEAIRMIPGHKHLVFEEGLQSAWLYETLSPHVDEIVVAGVTESRGQKDDKRDAYGLSEALRAGTLAKRVFKAPRQFTILRELCRTHMTITRDLVRVQARIKSLYRSRGIPTPGGWVYSPRRRGEWKKQLPASARRRAERLYQHFDFCFEQKKQAEADLLRESRKHRIVRILETAPGFGPVRSARLVPIVVTPPPVPYQAAVLELLRARDRDPLELGLGADERRRLGSSSCAADAGTLPAAQSGAEGDLQGHRHHGHHAAQQGSDLRSVPAYARFRHEANSREALTRSHHRGNGVADVERRGGVQAGVAPAGHGDRPRWVGDGSVRSARDRAATRRCRRENGSEVSIHIRGFEWVARDREIAGDGLSRRVEAIWGQPRRPHRGFALDRSHTPRFCLGMGEGSVSSPKAQPCKVTSAQANLARWTAARPTVDSRQLLRIQLKSTHSKP